VNLDTLNHWQNDEYNRTGGVYLVLIIRDDTYNHGMFS
jgi:hypothetical protein